MLAKLLQQKSAAPITVKLLKLYRQAWSQNNSHSHNLLFRKFLAVTAGQKKSI